MTLIISSFSIPLSHHELLKSAISADFHQTMPRQWSIIAASYKHPSNPNRRHSASSCHFSQHFTLRARSIDYFQRRCLKAITHQCFECLCTIPTSRWRKDNLDTYIAKWKNTVEQQNRTEVSKKLDDINQSSNTSIINQSGRGSVYTHDWSRSYQLFHTASSHISFFTRLTRAHTL